MRSTRARQGRRRSTLGGISILPPSGTLGRSGDRTARPRRGRGRARRPGRFLGERDRRRTGRDPASPSRSRVGPSPFDCGGRTPPRPRGTRPPKPAARGRGGARGVIIFRLKGYLSAVGLGFSSGEGGGKGLYSPARNRRPNGTPAGRACPPPPPPRAPAGVEPPSQPRR